MLSLAVYELSKLLNTGLDRETLVILMSLIQKGVNPEALATVVKDLRKEVASSSTIRSTSTSSPRTGATSTSTTAATTVSISTIMLSCW
jgi:mitotic-spindle organizing protein 1